jgi:hypothetical protein
MAEPETPVQRLLRVIFVEAPLEEYEAAVGLVVHLIESFGSGDGHALHGHSIYGPFSKDTTEAIAFAAKLRDENPDCDVTIRPLHSGY